MANCQVNYCLTCFSLHFGCLTLGFTVLALKISFLIYCIILILDPQYHEFELLNIILSNIAVASCMCVIGGTMLKRRKYFIPYLLVQIVYIPYLMYYYVTMIKTAFTHSRDTGVTMTFICNAIAGIYVYWLIIIWSRYQELKLIKNRIESEDRVSSEIVELQMF